MEKRKDKNRGYRGRNPLHRSRRLKLVVKARDQRVRICAEKGGTIIEALLPLVKRLPKELKKPKPNLKMIMKCEFLSREIIAAIRQGTRHSERYLQNLQRLNYRGLKPAGSFGASVVVQ